MAGFIAFGAIIASVICGFSLGVWFSALMVLLCAGFILYPRLERFLSVKRGGVMSHPLNLQRGFSLPEVLVAMVLIVMIVT
ncbi:prepilin-type N-terminal cleavage/methylation domain-containing protein, partial [Salmonella enterica subsp. enterica serovar Montevideo]|nr:prepilin-type N-terminal cleavage/methylation domain-containing protein [Salmonella enterica subsp. enterica serovar Montevideo]